MGNIRDSRGAFETWVGWGFASHYHVTIPAVFYYCCAYICMAFLLGGIYDIPTSSHRDQMRMARILEVGPGEAALTLE